MKGYLYVFVVFLFVACGENQPKSVTEIKHVPITTEDKVRDSVEIADTIFLDLTLQNKVFKVYAKKSGWIAETELLHFGAQKMDTSAVILAIDNKEEFLKLREQKNKLLTGLKEKIGGVDAELQEDLNYFISTLNPNTLLPEIESDKFSEKFIVWFKAQDTYNYYLKAREIENGMEDFFYLNEEPVYITSFYAQKGTFVQKGDLLYEYITDFDLIYSGVISDGTCHLPIEKVISSKQNKEITYIFTNNEIRIKRKIKGKIENTLPVKVVLQKFV